MTERIHAILDAVTDRVLAYRPADKGQQAKKVARRMKRQRKKEARRAMTNDFGSHLYKSPLARITALEAESAALRDMRELLREAFDETMRRYPDARAALAWFGAASGLRAGEVTPDMLAWASDRIDALTKEQGNG